MGAERRRLQRTSQFQVQELKLYRYEGADARQVITARLINMNEGGMGIETAVPLEAGVFIAIEGEIVAGGACRRVKGRARVAYCLSLANHLYRVGLNLKDGETQSSSTQGSHVSPQKEPFVDYYEVLQLSPNADLETIHRVYRALAQRYHPDNRESGDEEKFKLLLKAYRVLSDPEQRRAYDIEHKAAEPRRPKVLDWPKRPPDVNVEKNKRRKLLSLLYLKRISDPEQPSLTTLEMEEMLGITREQLQFSLWYLRESGWIVRGDNGRHFITAKGVDQAESEGVLQFRDEKLISTSGQTLHPETFGAGRDSSLVV